ncbi:hypothetical protein [Streptomyces fulvoviolaceus]|uniref:hypothetical protein n=1 Tax=Streptomyces fulvoviolaceus TaxID=285535 RepID=UPI0004C6F3BE|nr:hypothetical protein [Streptomyces fulvoviolaceus]
MRGPGEVAAPVAVGPISAVLQQFFSPLPEHAGDVWATINQPVTRFLNTHADGLPLTPSAAHALWLAGDIAIALLSEATRAFAARLTWALWGASTVWMTWAGTPAITRPTAAGLTALVWGIASILALNGLGSRPHITTINLIGDVPTTLQQHHSTDPAESDANSQEADSTQPSTAST